MDLEVYNNINTPMFSQEDQKRAVLAMVREKYGLSEKDMVPKPEERQHRAVVKWVMENYDILRVRSTCQYYFRPHQDGLYVFRHAEVKEDRDFREMVKQGYKVFGLAYTGNKIKNTVETLKEHVETEYNSIDQDIVEVNEGCYWDIRESKLLKEPSRECFVRLFDNTGHNTKNKVSINPKDIIVPMVKKSYRDALWWIEKNDGVLPMPDSIKEKDFTTPDLPYFQFIDTWACGNVGVYNDILKAASAVFMKKKPVGAFILTGLRRNGKSTFVKMLHLMLGRANTSSVRLAELHDPHKNLTLLGTLLNAPDEEIEGKDMSEEATADFKSMAAHEELTLPVMYSAQPQPISTDFVMFCPMNDDPEWKGNSASACTQRSLIIPFYADLSKMDNNGHDFEEETFTADMFQELLGVLFAFATYYKDKKIEFSSTMEAERQVASEVSDSRVNFAGLFCKWFVGYGNEQIVFDEYRAWCDYYGYQYVGKRKLMFAIDKVAHGHSRTNIVLPGAQRSQPAVRLGGKPGNQFFVDDYEIPEFKRTVGSILYVDRGAIDGDKQRTGNSVIVALEQWLAEKEVKNIREEQSELSGQGD